MRSKTVKRLFATMLCAVVVFSMAACGEGKENEGKENKTKQAETKKPEVNLDEVAKTIMMGTTSYSHGGILKADKYPCWEMIAVDRETGEQSDMVLFDDSVYIDGDEEMIAYFCSNEESPDANTSDTHDLMYVYTVPCDATVNIELISRVLSEKSDGILVSCYRNDKAEYLVEETVVEPNEEMTTLGAYSVDVKKGDKLYCVYNPNVTADDDEGQFYVKLVYVDVK